METDPVCKMEVDKKTAKYTAVYKEKTYYFCAPGCKKTFENDPLKYADEYSGQSMHSGHSCC